MAVQGKQGVGHGGRNGRQAGFAHALGRFGAGHDGAFDGRAFVHAQRRLVVEIAGLHLAVDDLNLAVQRRRQAVDDGAFQLLHDQLRVDGGTAVDGAPHAVDVDAPVLAHRHLGHLGHDGAKRFVQRHTACAPGRGGLAPAAHAGGFLQHGEVARVALQQVGAVLHRVGFCGVGHFVQKTFLKECLVRMPHGAPKAHLQRQVHGFVGDAGGGPFVGLVKRAF